MGKNVFIDNQSVSNINEIRLPKDASGVDLISFYDTSEANFAPSNLLVGKTAFAGSGLVEGTMPNLSVVPPPPTVQINENSIEGIVTSEGYINGETAKASISKTSIADYYTEGGQEFNFKAYEPIPPGSEVCHKLDFDLTKIVEKQLNSTSQSGGSSSSYGRIKVVDCGGGYMVIFHEYSNSYTLWATPIYVDPITNAVTAGSPLTISSTSYSGYQYDAIPLKKKGEINTNHIFVCHCYNNSYYLYGLVIELTKNASGPSCKIKTADTVLYDTTYEARYPISCCQMTDDGHILISCQQDSSNYVAVRPVTVNMTSYAITKGKKAYSSACYNNLNYQGIGTRIFRLTDSTALLLTAYSSNMYACIVTCAKGGTPTFGSFVSCGISQSGYQFDAIQISPTQFQVFMCGPNQYCLSSKLLTISGTSVSWGTQYYVNGDYYAGGTSSYQILHMTKTNKNHGYYLTGGAYQSPDGYMRGCEFFLNSTVSAAPTMKYQGSTNLYSNISTNGSSYWRHAIIDSNSGNMIIGCQYSASYLYVLVVPGYFALTKNNGSNGFGMSLNETTVPAGSLVTARTFTDHQVIKDYLMFK